MKRTLSIVLLVLALVACVSEDAPPAAIPSPSGSAEVDQEVVRQHASQFDDDLAERPAGSQEEFAAATYILGTLQQAGYLVRLESIPVEDLEKSTNVIALPPSGDDPKYMVVVGYDTGSQTRETGDAIGVLLELARALRVAEPRHDVAFVAVGAEQARVKGGAIGSRRLAQFLLDEDLDPTIIRLLEISDDSPTGAFKDYGDLLDPSLFDTWCRLTGSEPCARTLEERSIDPDPIGEADFRQVLVVGHTEDVSTVLLEYLTEHGR